jgi:lipid II isoglutaminyl synthase (glutamine-hydrolysing)
MKITILYLYYDLLNLYGESGNVKVLKKSLESLDIDVSLKFSTLDDEIDLTDVDLIYVGSGSEKNQLLALEHLKKYKEEMKEFILSGKFVLATGNAIELFGKEIDQIKALEVFSYSAKTSDKRIVDEALYKTALISSYILGFNNRNSFIVNNQHPFFQSIKGAGNNQNDVNEGYNEYHFYGTYLLGPLLARNPEFLRYFINELIKFKDPNFTIKKIPLNLEENAYQEFLKNYYSEYIS